MRHGLERLAILFCTPVDRQGFVAATNPDSLTDYMKATVLRGRDLNRVWGDYAPVAEAAQSLIRTARECGGTVFERATLNDFSTATSRFRFVVLFAHWRGAMVRPSDIVGSVAAVLTRMAEDPNLRRLKPIPANPIGIADALNRAGKELGLVGLQAPFIASAGKRSPAIFETLTRDLLDEALFGLLEPGNRVEMWDGLHTLADMESALAADFTGELDLAMCTSEALATFVDSRRRNAISHLYWPVEVLPTPQLIKTERTLRQMAATGRNYIETRLDVEEAEQAIQYK